MTESNVENRLREAWAEWCNIVRKTGDSVLATDCSLADKAEGLRWVTRINRYGLEAGIEFSDPRFPAFYMPTHETVKVMSDNPDAMHWMANIQSDTHYVVHATRGTNRRIMFTTLGRTSDGAMVQQSGIDASAMTVRPDGSFELHVSPRPQGENWLELRDGAVALLCRALFDDRGQEIAPTVRIEVAGSQSVPSRLDAASMASKLDRARMVFATSTGAIRAYADELRERGWWNSFGENPDGWGAGDPGVRYLHGVWRLAADEALVVELEPGECSFWNFQINNRWAESLDYLHRRVHLNARSAPPGADGKVRAVIAHNDPSLPNWLDTEGHAEGTMLVRAMDATAAPRFATRVVPVDELRKLQHGI